MLSDTWIYVPRDSYDDYSSWNPFVKAKSVETGAYDFKVNGGAGGYLTVMDTGDAKFVKGPDQTTVTNVAMGLVEDDIYTDKHYNATSLEA